MVNPGTLLTVMRHPDDAELWAGATIARHRQRGGTAVIAVPSHGDVRDAEATAGARLLDADFYQLPAVTADAIGIALAEVQPDVVITHPIEDIHPEHRQCAEALMAALPDTVIATGRPTRLYHCDSYNNLDRHGNPLHLPVIIDVTDTWPLKMQALRAHTSQPIAEHFGPMAEALGRLHGCRIERPYAEAFRALPILGRLPATTDL